MSTAGYTIALGAFLIALSVSLPAQALDPAIRCESAKVKEAGKYQNCRAKAESRAIKKGTSPAADIAKCDLKYGIKWPKIEGKGAGACPTNGDEASMRSLLTAQVADVTTLLSGGMLAPQPGIPATGQTTCWDSAGSIIPCAGTGQDGEFQAGAAQSYADNGDGTITDVNSGLMWEKLADDGSIHDVDDEYTSDDAFGVKVATLNGGSGFAGYTDWRLPNIKELVGVVNFGALDPAVSDVFHTGCAPACTVLTCSCTRSGFYWTSSTFEELGGTVYFYAGDWGFGGLSRALGGALSVRAVRGP